MAVYALKKTFDLWQRKRERRHTFHRGLLFLSACTVQCLNMALLNNIGVLFSDIMDTFHVDRAYTAAVQSVAVSIMQISGIVNGALINKFGPRRMGLCGALLSSFGMSISFVAESIIILYLGICIFAGIGISVLFIGSSTIVGRHFTGKSSALMLSLYSTSTGIGGLGFPYLLVYLRNEYGLKGAFLIVGGILLNSFAAALIWTAPVSSNNVKTSNVILVSHITNKHESNPNMAVPSIANNLSSDASDIFTVSNEISSSKDPQTKNITNIVAIKSLILDNKSFVLFTISTAISFQCFSLLLFFVDEFFIDKDFPESQTPVALMIFSLTGIVGRLIPGFLTKLPRVTTLSIPLLAVVLGLLSTIGLVIIESYWLMLVIYGVSGVGFGIVVSSLSATTAKLVGPQLLPNAMGIMLTTIGLATSVIGPVTGYIRSQTGSYMIPLVAIALSMALALALLVYAQWSRSRQRSR